MYSRRIREHAIAHCGLTPKKVLPDGTNASLKRSADGRAYESGYQTCGSVWICPECGHKISLENERLMAEAFGKWLDQGNFLFLTTLTASSERDDSLSDLLDRNQEAYSHLNSGRRRGRFLTDAHVSYVLKVLDITVDGPRGGWNPHLHLVVFVENVGQSPEEAQAKVEAYYRTEWTAGIAKQGNGSVSPTHGVDVRRVTEDRGLSSYLAKADYESVTSSHLPESASSHRSGLHFWQVLRAMSEGGKSKFERVFYEYSDATFGRTSVDWGRGERNIKKQLLGVPPERNLSDEEIAASEPSEDLPMVDMGKQLAHLFATSDTVSAHLLGCLESDGVEGVLQGMKALGVNFTVTWRTREIVRRFDGPIEVHLPLVEITQTQPRPHLNRAQRRALQHA